VGTYRALVDLWLPGNLYVLAGDTINDTGSGPGWPVPSGWILPCHAVDPLDGDAVTKVWKAGPQLSEGQPFAALGPYGNAARWVGGNRQPAAAVYWYSIGNSQWVLKGHEALGTRPVGSIMN
jgi:hypothetical protein